jgi:flagellar basal-body rod protein FlgB
VRTQPGHLPGTAATGGAQPEATESPAIRAPDGNAVALDTQLVKVADTATTQTLVTTIYKKYLGLFSLALGQSTPG